MRFLVALRSAGHARYLQSTIGGLCERGHEIVTLVGIQAHKGKGERGLLNLWNAELDELARELDGRLTVRPGVEPRRGSRQPDLGASLRCWLDYLRYLEPEFAEATKHRARALSLVPAALREPTETAAASPAFRHSLAAMVRAVEQSLPVPEPVRAVVEEESPDAVLVCPLLEGRSPQAAYPRAARELGIPSAACVASWDNLTTSSLIHGEPNLVTVWNEAQRKEASELHGIPADHVAVTGAPLYDPWFTQRPSTSREEFRAKVGLPADRPFVLYVCSSQFVAPDEAAWITHWIDAVRNSGSVELDGLPVLIRPHPKHRLLDDSAADALERRPGVVIHPREGALSLSGDELADYYDSIYHAAAVVGVNTSAMIESAIVGRGVHVLLTRRYRETQEDAPHFGHLRSAGGGLIEATRKERQHAAGLARAVRGEDQGLVAERSRRFLESFVRPHGLDQPTTPRMIDEVVQLAETGLPQAKRAPGPPSEELQAAIATLEPILGDGTRRVRAAPKQREATSGKQDERRGAPRRRKRAQRQARRAGAGQRRGRRRSSRGGSRG